MHKYGEKHLLECAFVVPLFFCTTRRKTLQHVTPILLEFVEKNRKPFHHATHKQTMLMKMQKLGYLI